MWLSIEGKSGMCSQSTFRAFEWRSGATTSFVDHCSNESLVVQGDFACWPFNLVGPTTCRNLASGVVTNITWPIYENDAGTVGHVFDYSLAPNGDVVGVGADPTTTPYTDHVVRYRAGVFSTVFSLPTSPHRYGTLTDGVNIVVNASTEGGYQTALIDPSGTITPLSDVRPGTVPSTGWYAASGGWAAYLKKSATSGVQQVWTRSPVGAQAQVSVFGSDSMIETLDSAGEVMFFTRLKRYRATAGAAANEVSWQAGTGKAIGGGWYVVMGRTLFHVVGTPVASGADAGPDGGSDGGTDGAVDAAPDSTLTGDAAAPLPTPESGSGGCAIANHRFAEGMFQYQLSILVLLALSLLRRQRRTDR